MKAPSGVALAVVLWGVVVILGASIVWAVISRAGVSLGEGTVQTVQPETPAPLDSASDPTRSSSPRPSRTPSPDSSPGEASPSSNEPEVSEPASVRASWQGGAGVVVAECRGAVIDYSGSTPNSGYEMEVEDVGPDRVRVDFEYDDGRVRVEAGCRGGVPVFTEGD